MMKKVPLTWRLTRFKMLRNAALQIAFALPGQIFRGLYKLNAYIRRFSSDKMSGEEVCLLPNDTFCMI